MTDSAARGAFLFTAAVAISNASQVAWLAAGARALTTTQFGVVLTAQAMYGLLQIITDNGPSFLGARQAARGSLTASDRAELVRARIVLATACATVGIGIASIGGPDLVRAFLPFAVALGLFSVLNVWEPYGRGRLGPFALYLLLRSLVVATVAGAVAIAGGELPVEAVGLCEVAAVLIVGTTCSAWSRPRGWTPVSRGTWRSIRDIGLPAIITQYNVAVGTVVLGVSGEAAAAAVAGVAFRLLTGVQGLNGAVAAGLFPRLARTAEPAASDAGAARAATAGGVLLGAAMLAVVAVAAGPIVRVLLDDDGDLQQTVIILAVGTTGVAGLVMHRSFALVAGGGESQLRRASLPGALVVTAMSVLAAVVGGLDGALVAVAGYLIGLSVTSLLIERGSPPRQGVDLAVVGSALLVMPAVATSVAIEPALRIPVAAVVISSICVAVAHVVRNRKDLTEANPTAAAPERDRA